MKIQLIAAVCCAFILSACGGSGSTSNTMVEGPSQSTTTLSVGGENWTNTISDLDLRVIDGKPYFGDDQNKKKINFNGWGEMNDTKMVNNDGVIAMVLYDDDEKYAAYGSIDSNSDNWDVKFTQGSLNISRPTRAIHFETDFLTMTPKALQSEKVILSFNPMLDTNNLTGSGLHHSFSATVDQSGNIDGSLTYKGSQAAVSGRVGKTLDNDTEVFGAYAGNTSSDTDYFMGVFDGDIDN